MQKQRMPARLNAKTANASKTECQKHQQERIPAEKRIVKDKNSRGDFK